MAGMSSSELRSAYIAETTPGTIPSTPGFTTFNDPCLMRATPNIAEQRSLQAKGARESQSIRTIAVSGSMAGKLVYGNLDPILETLLQGAWSSDVLKDGKSVKTVAVENAIAAGVGGTTTMMRYRGVQATGLTLVAASGEDITYDMQLVGMGSDAGTTTAITGATYSAPSGSLPLTAGLDVGSITAAGYTVDAISRAEVAFNFEGRNSQGQLGSFDLSGVTRGALLPVVTLRTYVDSNFLALYNAVRANHSTFAVTIPLGSVSGSKYTVLFPQCAFASADLDFGSVDAMHDLVVYPQYDSATNNSVVKITRAVA